MSNNQKKKLEVQGVGIGKVDKVNVADDDKNDEDDQNEGEELGDENDVEEDNGELDLSNLPKSVWKRVIAIRKSQASLAEIDKEYKQERIEMEKKYLQKKQSFYNYRFEIVTGVREPVEADKETTDPADGTAEAVKEAEEEHDDELEDVPTKGIKGFWLQCLSAHPSIGGLITEEDEPALEALADIKCEYDDSFNSFTLFFHFEDNDYFTNKILTKKYVVSPDLLDDKAPALTDTEGSEINWKQGKDLCVKEIKKKQRAKSGKNKGQVRTITKTIPKHSFFHYFSKPLTEEEQEEEEQQEEGGDEDKTPIKLTMEEDYDIGHSIRTSIIPEAVLWFTGEAGDEYDDEGNFDGEEENDEDEDEDDDDDNDEDGDDEDEDDAPKPKSKKPTKPKGAGLGGNNGGAAPGGGSGEGQQQPECKQN